MMKHENIIEIDNPILANEGEAAMPSRGITQKIKWFDNEFTKNNWPDVLYQEIQKYFSLEYVLERGEGVLDAGAHIGDYGVCLAHALTILDRTDIKVYCVEPTPLKCEFIEQVCRLNNLDNLKIICKGLSDKNGKYSVKYHGLGGLMQGDGTSDPLDALLRPTGTNTGAWQWTPDPDGLEFITLDELWEKGEIGKIGFFWLDAQWMEKEVLLGGERFLKTCKPYILMEYWPCTKYCSDGVSVEQASRGSREELEEDETFQEIFKDYGIVMSDVTPTRTGTPAAAHFDDILLEFI